MEFGLLLPTEMPDAVAPADQLATVRDIVVRANRAGFRSLWALHHYVSNVRTFQPLTLLASLVDISVGMTLGTGVLVLPLMHPVAVAEEFATLDVVSGGRTVLGVAAGYWEPEFQALDVPFKGRSARMEESIAVIRRLWAGESLTVGDGVEVSLAMPPAQPGGPPIWLGGVTRRAIERAAQMGDGWLLPPDLDPRALAPRIDQYRREMDALGRDVEVLPTQRELLVAPTHDEALRDARTYLRQNAEVYVERGMTWIDEHFDRWMESSYLVGTPEDICEKLDRLRDLGITEIHARIAWGDCPAEVAQRTVELMGSDVIPSFLPGVAHRSGGR